MPITLSPDQNLAVHQIMSFLADKSAGEMVLGGKAGTGKSFLTKYILNEIEDSPEMKAHKLLANNHEGALRMYLTSTTNKAADVLRGMTGFPVTTIHKLLGLRVVNDYKTGHTKLQRTERSTVIQRSFIIIDEASMIDEKLLKMIRDLTMKCKVLYIGDPYQLAPVKKTDSPVFKSVTDIALLTQIQRQAAGSSIIQYADKFREAQDTGIFPKIESYGSDILHLDALQFQNQVDKQFISLQHRNHARIVSWSNNRIHQYNNYIRKLNNLPDEWTVGEFAFSNSPIHIDGAIIAPTDAIVEITDVLGREVHHNIAGQTLEVRGYSVFQADNQVEVSQLLKWLYKNEQYEEYFKAKEFFVDLRPLYANTINKAQGSTYDVVFIDLNDIGRNTQNKNIARLMYTAITRASDKVYMYGELPTRLY